MNIDLAGVVNKNRVISSFLLQGMIGGYLCVSGTCILQLSSLGFICLAWLLLNIYTFTEPMC